ncbi:transposase [Marispirochaeta sp.]|uniref:transposase n=1 Tax=Marispirochaeta sp. TaxID=2038653 RepID=UPI0029C631CC|nr:transposase [Marispirochaeta sp.]
MITFTVPAPFRTFFRQHQRFAYAAFFAATSGIMKKPASEQTWFPGDVPGFFSVLHTWGRQLQYHPHIHYVVPGGTFSSEDHSRHPCRKAFYLPVRVAANFFLLSHKALRVFFRHDRRLFAEISKMIFAMISDFYREVAGKEIRTGMVIAHLRFLRSKIPCAHPI